VYKTDEIPGLHLKAGGAINLAETGWHFPGQGPGGWMQGNGSGLGVRDSDHKMHVNRSSGSADKQP